MKQRFKKKYKGSIKWRVSSLKNKMDKLSPRLRKREDSNKPIE
jgi:hypothetical protein